MEPLKSEPQTKHDKYYYYRESVQSPDADVEFLQKTYEELKGKPPISLREDFCGTHAICCEWVRLNDNHVAHGVDLDPEPLAYGEKSYASQLTEDQRSRLTIYNKNVLDDTNPGTDIILAVNFSYYIFKKRQELLNYFKKCQEKVNPDGLFILDCFGGSQCMEPNEEETEHDNFSYVWDQDHFDPVTNSAKFYIHFEPKGEPKMERAFSYDWRMWSIPELKDIMIDAGFSKVHTYWEGTDEDGDGNGEFTKVEEGEDCEAWVAYVVAEK